MKLISFKITAADSEIDLIDVELFDVFDLPDRDKSFQPIIFVDPCGDDADQLRTNINRIFGNLLDLECRVTGDDLSEWEFELIYLLDATAEYPDRLVRVFKILLPESLEPDGAGVTDYLRPTYQFEYTYDIEPPIAGRVWVKAEILGAEDLLLPIYTNADPDALLELIKEVKPNTLFLIDSATDLSPLGGQSFLSEIEAAGNVEHYSLLVFTNSPTIIADVDRASVFVLSSDFDDNIFVVNPDFQTFGCDPTIILAKIFGIGPMSGRAAAKMISLMSSDDPAKILQSMPLFGDSVEKAYLFDRYRQLLTPEN